MSLAEVWGDAVLWQDAGLSEQFSNMTCFQTPQTQELLAKFPGDMAVFKMVRFELVYLEQYGPDWDTQCRLPYVLYGLNSQKFETDLKKKKFPCSC